MALYLRDFIADDALLAYPYGANFDYHSILLACKDFHGKEEISVQEWIEIARNRFGFTLEQANAYSSVYFSLFCDQVQSTSTLKPIPFTLFLYNQLFNSLGGLPNSNMKADSEYPTGKEESHDPLGNLIYPHFSSRISIVSLDDLEDDQVNCKSFPTVILEKRHKVAAFWRSTIKKWLHLLFAILSNVGAEDDPFTFNIPIILSNFHYLELFFAPISAPKDSHEFIAVRNRFQSWLYNSKDDYSSATSDSRSLKSSNIVFCECSLIYLLDHYFNGTTLTIDLLTSWLQWSIMEKPARYEALDISSNGLLNPTSDIIGNQIFSCIDSPDVLISRRRGLTIGLHSNQFNSKKLILHRLQNCEVYMLGPIDSLIISKCRNSTIFAGAVKGIISVRSCSKVSISGNCRGIRFLEDDSNSHGGTGNKAFINTQMRPIIEGYTINPIDGLLTLAPCNIFYKGIIRDLEMIEHDLLVNFWNDPFNLKAESSSYSILSPSKFEFNEVPFDIVNPAISDIAEQSHDKIATGNIDALAEFQKLIEYLPSSYSTWVIGSAVYSANIQSIFKRAHAIDPQFSGRIQKYFDSWLETSQQKGSSVLRLAKQTIKLRQD